MRRCLILMSCALQTWQRPTLPRLKTEYHWRWGVSRPCSEWERVQPPRNNHQVGKTQQHKLFSRSWVASPLSIFNTSHLTYPYGALLKIEHATHTDQRSSRLVARPVRSPSGVRTEVSSSSSMKMNIINGNEEVDRAISNGKLHTLLHFHTRPINVVVFHGSDREHSFSGWFPA